jgi:isopenicillin-N N-acyltransferase like protein
MSYPRFISSELTPRNRGQEFGEAWREKITATVEGYRGLFAKASSDELHLLGTRALERIDNWAPELSEEMRGLAEGAAVPVRDIAAVNARTEILAALGHRAAECSAIVALRGPDAEPVAMQNWDWYAGFADQWLVWEIPHLDGRRTITLTEFGVLGKIGVNSQGVGCLFNVLHHRSDGAFMGVPVHVIARRLIDEAQSVSAGLKLIGTAQVSASTAITVIGSLRAGKSAISAELWPDGPHFLLPDPDGLLLHTNHFLSPQAVDGDTEPVNEPDTLVRLEVLRRYLSGRGKDLCSSEALDVLCDHTGYLCCHPEPGQPLQYEFQTLASVRINFAASDLDVISGPPCTPNGPGNVTTALDGLLDEAAP